MHRQRHHELLAGVFVVLTVAAAVGVMLWIGSWNLFGRSGMEAYFYADLSSGPHGLEIGNDVRINDCTVGKITDIRTDLAAGRTVYTAEIFDRKLHVGADAQALAAKEMVGPGRLVLLSLGTKAAPPADERHAVRISGGLEEAMTNLSVISDQLKGITTALRREVDMTHNAAALVKVHEILNQVQTAAGNIARVSELVLKQADPSKGDSMMAQINKSLLDINRITASLSRETSTTQPTALLAKIHRSADDVNAITADARPKIEKTLTAVQETAQQIESLTKGDVAAVLADLRQINSKVLKIASDVSGMTDELKQSVVVNRDRIDAVIDNIAQITQDLKATGKEVRRNPWRLMYKPDQKEERTQNLYDAARAFAEGAGQLEGALSKLSAIAKANPDGIKTDDTELQKVRRQISETFGNFSKAEKALWDELAK